MGQDSVSDNLHVIKGQIVNTRNTSSEEKRHSNGPNAHHNVPIGMDAQEDIYVGRRKF